MASTMELVAEAKARLEVNRTSVGLATIDRLKRTYGLGQEVELALRMLPQPKLQELSANLVTQRWQLLEMADSSCVVMSLVSQLDPEVEALVAGLMEVDAQQEGPGGAAAGERVEQGQPAEVAWPEEEMAPPGRVEAPSTDVVAKARERLNANRGKMDLSAIQRLKGDCGLTDDVELALRMLLPESLREVLAGWSDIKQKCREKKDGGQFLIKIISQLDPEVEEMITALQELDKAGKAGAPGRAAEAVAPQDARRVDPVQTARGRLEAPKSKAEMAAVKRLKAACGFGDEVELALQMLSSPHLREILAGEAEIIEKAAGMTDPGKFMLWLISQLDAEVEVLVKKLMDIDGGIGGAAAAPAVLRPSPPQRPPPPSSWSSSSTAAGASAAAGPQSNEAAVAEAQQRLQANRNNLNLQAIQSFRQSLGLGDEVELALRMLDSRTLWKILHAKAELRRELATARDKDAYLLSYISQHDHTVEALVRKFRQIDHQSSEKGERGRSRSPRRLPAASAIRTGKGLGKGPSFSHGGGGGGKGVGSKDGGGKDHGGPAFVAAGPRPPGLVVNALGAKGGKGSYPY